MSEQNGILSFMACRRCVESGKRSQTVAGLTDPFTLRLWCERHNMLIADFTLAEPIKPYCEICDEEIGPNHTH